MELRNLQFGQNFQGGGGVPNSLEHFFRGFFSHNFRFSKSAGIKKYDQMSHIFLQANNMKICTVLSHFAKFCDSHIKVLCNFPKYNGPVLAKPVFRLCFFMASLDRLGVARAVLQTRQPLIHSFNE